MRSYFSLCSNINIVQQTGSQPGRNFPLVLESYLYELHFVRYIKTESTDLPTVQHFFAYLQYGHSCCWMLCKQWTSILCFFFSFVNKVLFSIISFFFYILWSCKEVFIVQSRHDLTVQTHTEAFLKTNFNALFSFSNIISLSLASDLRIRKKH